MKATILPTKREEEEHQLEQELQAITGNNRNNTVPIVVLPDNQRGNNPAIYSNITQMGIQQQEFNQRLLSGNPDNDKPSTGFSFFAYAFYGITCSNGGTFPVADYLGLPSNDEPLLPQSLPSAAGFPPDEGEVFISGVFIYRDY